MSVNIIYDLEIRKRGIESSITNEEFAIRKTERLYDSLVDFKRVVIRSQETFNSVNSFQSRYLEEINKVRRNSKVAEKYYSGMKTILFNLGRKTIGGVYIVLLANISSKLRRYLSNIDKYEKTINAYQKMLADVNKQIDIESRKQSGWN